MQCQVASVDPVRSSPPPPNQSFSWRKLDDPFGRDIESARVWNWVSWGRNRASACLKPRISPFPLRLLFLEGYHFEISDVSCQSLFQVETDLVALHWSAVGSAMIVWPPESRRWMSASGCSAYMSYSLNSLKGVI